MKHERKDPCFHWADPRSGPREVEASFSRQTVLAFAAMKRRAYIVVGITVLLGCSPSQSETPNDPNELTLEVVAEECERLIGSINAGRLHVEDVAAKATAVGRDEFDDRAKAHESIARTVGETPYKTPDLQRLAGFYVGISIGQAAIMR